MTTRRLWLVLLSLAAAVWALGGEWVTISRGIPENHLLDAMVGISFFGAGIVLIDRRPGNLIGPLMVASAACWFAGNWSNLDAWPTAITFAIGSALGTPLLAHIFLAYPSGHVRRGFDRFVLWSVYLVAITVGLVHTLTFDPRAFGCDVCYWTPSPFPSETISDAAGRINDVTTIALAVLFFAAILRRWYRASPAERRSSTPLWIAAAALAVAVAADTFASNDPFDGFTYLLWEIRSLLLISVPIILLWGLLSSRLARSAVGDLVVELEGSLPTDGLQAAMARTIGDPTLELAYPIEGEGRWADVNGHPVDLPEPGEGRHARAVTLVERDGDTLAALIHDPALDPELVRAAAAAAGMAIANERLRARVRAQLEEMRASRQRIVEAGDRERRRVERDLHDGAQQRLVTVSLALAMLRDRPELDPAAGKALEDTAAELKRAIAELRDLARGIHPAILTEEGLGPAVESLAARCGLPVRVVAALDGRLPGPVEATAYFVVSESLANVAKYANATGATVELSRSNGSLLVSVRDDGVGGADPHAGSGLGGLQDRVAAMGGTLRVDSPRGKGTRVTAEIPCDG
jgi:signal transduction histidine kinase